MLTTTRDMVMPTAITGSYPRPLWYNANLDGRSFKAAMGDSMFREQYLDAVAAVINAQEAAGLDIVTDGDSRFDLNVGGKSWFFYPIERLGGIKGHRSTSQGWLGRDSVRPGRILYEVQEAYQPAIVAEKLSRGPLEYAALWQVAQRLTDKPVKFGTICAPVLASMLWNSHYRDNREMILDLCDIMNAELKELVAAGCRVIQLEETPRFGFIPAGAIPTSSGSIGRCRAMSGRCLTCCGSTPTSSPSSAAAATARTSLSSANTPPTKRSASASSAIPRPRSSGPSMSPR